MYDYKQMLTHICITLRNCSDCITCNPERELGIHCGLDVTDRNTFRVESQSERTSKSLIEYADRFNYEANITNDGEHEYVTFTKT